MALITKEDGSVNVDTVTPLDIAPFSCYRIKDVSALNTLAQESMSSREQLQAFIDEGALALDAARALYLVREERTGQIATALLCGVTLDLVDDLLQLYPSELDRNAETAAAVARASAEVTQIGAHTSPIAIYYQQNMAADIILSAAASGTALYHLQDKRGWTLDIWRIGRPETIEALSTLFSSFKWPSYQLWAETVYQAEGYRDAGRQMDMNLRARLIPALLVANNSPVPTVFANMIIHSVA